MNPDAQSRAILRYLKRGLAITPIEALELFDCFRLGARIYDLRQAGNNIVTDWLTTETGKRVGSYRLVSE